MNTNREEFVERIRANLADQAHEGDSATDWPIGTFDRTYGENR